MSEISLKKYFNFFCIAEFISCFFLFVIAMPLKYGTGIIWPMPFIGMFHGIAFIGYVLFAFLVRKLYKWDDEEFVFVLLFSFIPFMTWFVHKKIKKKDLEEGFNE